MHVRPFCVQHERNGSKSYIVCLYHCHGRHLSVNDKCHVYLLQLSFTEKEEDTHRLQTIHIYFIHLGEAQHDCVMKPTEIDMKTCTPIMSALSLSLPPQCTFVQIRDEHACTHIHHVRPMSLIPSSSRVTSLASHAQPFSLPLSPVPGPPVRTSSSSSCTGRDAFVCLSRLEEEHRNLSQVEVDEVLGLVRDV